MYNFPFFHQSQQQPLLPIGIVMMKMMMVMIDDQKKIPEVDSDRRESDPLIVCRLEQGHLFKSSVLLLGLKSLA